MVDYSEVVQFDKLSATLPFVQPLGTRLGKRAERAFYLPDSKQWKNPYLIVLRQGIEVVAVTDKGGPAPVSAIREILERLPNSAWPYGLVAAVQDSSIQSQGDAQYINANRKELLRLLRDLHVEVEPWP